MTMKKQYLVLIFILIAWLGFSFFKYNQEPALLFEKKIPVEWYNQIDLMLESAEVSFTGTDLEDVQIKFYSTGNQGIDINLKDNIIKLTPNLELGSGGWQAYMPFVKIKSKIEITVPRVIMKIISKIQSGDLKAVDLQLPEFEHSTVEGNVILEENGFQKINIKTDNGNISMSVKKYPMTIKYNVSAGEIRVEGFTKQEHPELTNPILISGGGADINLTTNHGSINILGK